MEERRPLSSIMIFNLEPIIQFDPDEIMAAVTESNFHTLCDQYGLDPALIEPARTHLAIQVPIGENIPFLGLRFAPEPAIPIIVNCWRDDKRVKSHIQQYSDVASLAVREHLAQSKEVLAVELARLQSSDLGILLAYELARWISFKGTGLIYALDGVWYRLNAHKAFLPVI